jgi:hypothetical protein
LVDLVKKSIEGASSNDGEFETSATTEAPTSTLDRPSPVTALTPVDGAAATAWCPCSVNACTTFEPIRPVPPMTTIFMTILS